MSADPSEELDSYQETRRSSTASPCIHDHHCGSQAPSIKQSRTNLSSMELPFRNGFAQMQPMKTFNSTFKKRSYTFKQAPLTGIIIFLSVKGSSFVVVSGLSDLACTVANTVGAALTANIH
eukprot:bmy_19575T0